MFNGYWPQDQPLMDAKVWNEEKPAKRTFSSKYALHFEPLETIDLHKLAFSASGRRASYTRVR